MMAKGEPQLFDLEPRCKKCHGSGWRSEWHVEQAFNPGSALQKAELIRHLGLKMPVKRGEQRETTEAKYLRRFAKKHPVFATIIDCQQREKLISTYMWEPNAEGRVTTTFGFHPSTWRKSSRNVNLQNIPKRTDLAQAFRSMLVAAPGNVLVEADSSAIEAVLTGYAAGDEGYVRMARLGIHDFVAANWLGAKVDPSAPDAELRNLFRQIKHAHPQEREASKRAVHGLNYMLSAYGLHDEHPQYFPTRKRAEEFQEFYFGLFPKLKQWQQSTLERAHRETYLENHYQYRHYFFSVYQYDKRRGQWTLGDDAKRAIAFVPSSDASAIQTEDILTLAADPEVEPWLRLIIHDSVILECPKPDVDTVAAKVYSTMTRSRPELGGLSIGAEIQAGCSLGEMEVWHG